MSKRSIILCEGFDEVYILGYYLFKTNSWKKNKNKKFSELMSHSWEEKEEIRKHFQLLNKLL